MSVPPLSSPPGSRIVICDYNQLLQSVTGLLRMSGYAVFQAYNGPAAEELCNLLPEIRLLVLNTFGTGVDLNELVRRVRKTQPDLPVLHIGNRTPPGLPADVVTLPEDFDSTALLTAVDELIGTTAAAQPKY